MFSAVVTSTYNVVVQMMNLKLRLTKEEGIREGSVANSLTTSYYSSF